MKPTFKKITSLFILPILLSTLLISTGFSMWYFTEGSDNELSSSVTVTTTGVEGIGSFFKHYEEDIESNGTHNAYTGNKTNYMLVDEFTLDFLYDYYVHFTFNDTLPNTGTISFKVTLTIDTIAIKLSDIFPFSYWDGDKQKTNDGYLTLIEMLALNYRNIDDDENTFRAFDFSTLDGYAYINNLKDYGNYFTATTINGYDCYTMELPLSLTFHSTINLADKYDDSSYNYEHYASSSLCLKSSDEFDINYKTTYLTYTNAQKEEILKKGRILTDKTNLSIDYKVSYTQS